MQPPSSSPRSPRAAQCELRHVVVTGGAGQIGRAIVECFLAQGATVHAIDADGPALDELEAETADGPGRLRPIALELGPSSELHPAEPKTWARIRADMADALGPCGHVLVNNLGGGIATTVEGCTPQVWQRDLDHNLGVAYRCCHALLPSFIAAGQGIIINIGSVNARTALGHPAYSAAKAGLASLTRALAVEFGPRGIRANMVSPATVRSALWDDRERRDPAIFARLMRWYPLERLVEPSDVAAAVEFLASEAARAITGVDLPVDCGLSAGNRVMASELTLEEF